MNNVKCISRYTKILKRGCAWQVSIFKIWIHIKVRWWICILLDTYKFGFCITFGYGVTKKQGVWSLLILLLYICKSIHNIVHIIMVKMHIEHMAKCTNALY
jgi:hypothetical protein